MGKGRVEAFSDAVFAILITIMVLELKEPQGADFGALGQLVPTFLSYLLSFVYLGIYWNSHHHMLHASRKVDGRVLWANLHLLFWLSLVPCTTNWIGDNGLAPAPTATYGVVLLMCGVAYWIVQQSITRCEGAHSLLRVAIGNDLKGKLSPLLYLIAIGMAFVAPIVSDVIYVVVALWWLMPDKRIERVVMEHSA